MNTPRNHVDKVSKLNRPPWEKLALAILAQAAHDAQVGDKAALRWLAEDGGFILECLGFDANILYDCIDRWADIPPVVDRRHIDKHGAIVVQLGMLLEA